MKTIITYEHDDAGKPGISPERRNMSGEEGFSLIETTCAMVIILIALLGVAFSFTYAINYNAGNQSRTECLAVLQQEVEQMRAAKFTPSVTDPGLTGGAKLPRTIISSTGKRFLVTVSVDNDPNTAGIQSDTDVPVPTIKEVTISAKLEAPSPGWQITVPSTIVLRRVRAN
ncbi:MAG: type II secretion system protein [Pyrinomonadaceae bacterium]|nr:type II secretion system protein [Acidobacteriota bacterium]MBK7933550.1 type II secretion system protein [Acidobacteriota bacterium]MBP7376002.1 type II secretion system protein [Pyrinomonadaceae bacterium]